MGDTSPSQSADAPTGVAPTPEEERWGWRLYGVIRSAGDVGGATGANPPLQRTFTPDVEAEDQPLEVVASGAVAALTQRVELASYSAERLLAHAEDRAWVEEVARRHNAVVEAVHRTQTILPAKFGMVYARLEDVRLALAQAQTQLLERLERLANSDEWGVRLFGDVARLRERAATEGEAVSRLHAELSVASPGRAYFLRRKLADELNDAVDRLLDEVTAQTYTACARHAREGQVERRAAGISSAAEGAELEILQATFLIPREATSDFIADVCAFAESQPGLRCEYSGPWPLYSFARFAGELEQDTQQAEEE